MSGLRTKLASPRLQAQLNSVLRIDVVEGYTEAWMQMISHATGKDLSDSIRELPVAIQMRLVKRIEVAFKRGESFRADISFDFDWEQFKMEVHQNGERMILNAGVQGNLPASMVATIERCERLVSDLWKSTGADSIQVWWTLDDEAIEKYGRDETCRRLGLVEATDRERMELDKRRVDTQHKILDPSTGAVTPSITAYLE